MRTFLNLTGVALILAVSTSLADGQVKKKEGSKKVELQGVLKTGIVAIGGETTGTVLETKQGAFELDLGKNAELRARADKLNGKAVAVGGVLNVRKGVEVKQRKIVTVTSLEEMKGK
jgi:hypothetical protein